MPSAQMKTNVAFIGLCGMGMLMARRLIDSGLTVSGYDMNPVTTAALECAGGTASASPALAAANASIVILMVARAEQIMSVLFAPRTGAVHALTENATIILHCTVQPAVLQDVRSRLGSEYRRSDVVVMDAPVTGSMKEAEDGTLTMMISAAKANYLERSDIRDVLACTAQRVHHIIGPLGSALKVKLLNQALCGIHVVAAAEIIGLAAVIALDTKRFFKCVTSPRAELGRRQNCWSWMFEDSVPRMLDDELPWGFAMRNVIRDVRIVNNEAERFGARLSLLKASQFVYEEAIEMGFEDADDGAVLTTYLRRENSQGSDQINFLQTVSELGGLWPEEEATRLYGLLCNALAAIHAMAAYEALVFAEGMHMCKSLKQCKQWIEILGSACAGSTMFVDGMPRIFDSETHGTGALQLLVPRRETLLESLVSSGTNADIVQGLVEQADILTQREAIELAQDEDYTLTLLPAAEAFFRQVIDGKIQHHGRSVILVSAS